MPPVQFRNYRLTSTASASSIEATTTTATAAATPTAKKASHNRLKRIIALVRLPRKHLSLVVENVPRQLWIFCEK